MSSSPDCVDRCASPSDGMTQRIPPQRAPSDMESQISLPRSYTLPRQFKYYRQGKTRKVLRTEHFVASTNSSDGTPGIFFISDVLGDNVTLFNILCFCVQEMWTQVMKMTLEIVHHKIPKHYLSAQSSVCGHLPFHYEGIKALPSMRQNYSSCIILHAANWTSWLYWI